MTDEAERRREAWEHLHRKALTDSGESLSGSGSSLAQTRVLRERLDGFLQKIGAGSMLDAPCGDYHWLAHAHLSCSYVGVDIVPDLIERNRRRYPGCTFRVVDLVMDRLPRVDLILCRDALVHYSFSAALAILRNFRASGAEWLLTTTFPGRDEHCDIALGGWRPINLELPPFRFPPPEQLIVERCSEIDGLYRDKSLGLWRFADLELGDIAGIQAGAVVRG